MAMPLVLAGACAEDPLSRDATASAPARGAANTDGAAPGSDDEALQHAIDAFNSGTYTITYRFRSQVAPTGDGSDDTETPSAGDPTPQDVETVEGTGTVTIYRDGAERSRIDTDISYAGLPMSLSVIATPEVTAVCVKDPGTLALVWPITRPACIDDETAANLGAGFGFDAVDLFTLPEDEHVTSRSSLVIDGHDSTCFETQPEVGATAMICFDDRGILAYEKSTKGTEFVEMTAESVELSVVVVDAFTLPYARFEPLVLEVRNDTDVEVFVHGNSGGEFNDGELQLEPHASGVLRTGFRGTPRSINFGTYTIPQWSGSCTWEEAKAHEPIVVAIEIASCAAPEPTPSPRSEPRPTTTALSNIITLPAPLPSPE